MSKEQQKTYLEALRVHLDRCEEGTIEDLFQPNNGFIKVPIKLPKQVKYFEPAIQPKLDQFGQPE